MNNLEKIVSIEKTLFEHAQKMNNPTLEEDLGVLIFEATFYKYSKNNEYKEKAITLLNKAIEVFSSKELPMGFFEGFEGIFWVVQYLNQCNIIDDESLLNDLKPYLLQSLETDIADNNFDTIHGGPSKLQYLINSENSSEVEKNIYVDKFIESLYNNRQENEKGIYWYDIFEEEKGLVNLGLAHGLAAMLTFVSRLKEQGFKNPKIDILIKGITKSLLTFKNDSTQNSHFPDYFSELGNNKNVNSRLAWCYGDLGISYAFLYSSIITENKDLKLEALKVINSVVKRGISDSKLDHFEEYFFFDTAFCHGISGIVYILSKINQHLQNPLIEQRLNYWKSQLIHNLDIQLKIQDDIYYPWYRQDKEKSFVLDKCSMLTGLTGTGLVLLSLQYDTYDWSDFFLLY